MLSNIIFNEESRLLLKLVFPVPYSFTELNNWTLLSISFKVIEISFTLSNFSLSLISPLR